MLTFRFDGAAGQMIRDGILTSGMVGQEIELEFSSEWKNMSKTVVFTAGDVTRDVVDVTDDVVTIPAEVLAKPYNRLRVGVYGVSPDGRVRPTICVNGPIIHPGADPSGDPGTDPALPVWAQLLAAVEELRTNGTPDGNVEVPIIAGSGLSAAAKNLLITILRNCIYHIDQSANITALANALESGGNTGGDTGGEVPEVITYTVTNDLTEATTNNAATTAERNTAYTAIITPSAGYHLNEVTVTMGGANVTDSVYANGNINIPAVTGNVVITATAVAGENTSGYANLFDKDSMLRTGGFIVQGGYLYGNNESKYAVVPVESGKRYALQGGWSAFSTTAFGALAFGSDDNWGESGKEYYIKPAGGLNGLYCYDSADQVTDAFTASKDASGKGMTFTVPAGCTHVAFSIYIKNTNSNCDPGTVMLEAGDTCHDYVPYAG